MIRYEKHKRPFTYVEHHFDNKLTAAGIGLGIVVYQIG